MLFGPAFSDPAALKPCRCGGIGRRRRSERRHNRHQHSQAKIPMLTNEDLVHALDAHRYAHAAADAKRGKAFAHFPALHLVQKGGQHAGT